ncbi:hypothetical protein SpCBS45565_g02741 [Spizellomyces sp. 'palustris']|nr:hypothetical protein SpCBS45565_g02741 [Spizellomyces sp. 'palustris']
MDSFLWLLILSFSMLSGSFLAGNIPLAFHFSEERLRLVSTFGSGMLVGTALIVILPEGVETLYSVQLKSQMAEKRAAAEAGTRHGRRASELAPDIISSKQETRLAKRGEQAPSSVSWWDATTRRTSSGRRALQIDRRAQQDVEHPRKIAENGEVIEDQSAHTDHHDHSAFEAHRYIGAALAIGFAFMFLIENAGHFGHSHKTASHIVTVNDFRDVAPYKNTKTAATIGLVVHAAADGIALGAASASDRTSLELIVFLAIMLHKAPSAFGLATFLLAEGHTRKVVRQHLLVFSLAAPLAAIATYTLLFNYGIDDPIIMHKWTGILLLFSAGTFLYVATVHILPEIYVTGKGRSGGGGGHDKKLSLTQIVCLLGGIFSPLLLAVEHSH